MPVPSPTTTWTRRRLVVESGSIGLGAHNREGLVELDIDLTSIVEGDLDLVVTLLILYLGFSDGATAKMADRRVGCSRKVRTSDRNVDLSAVPGTAGRLGDRRNGDCDNNRTADQQYLDLSRHVSPFSGLSSAYEKGAEANLTQLVSWTRRDQQDPRVPSERRSRAEPPGIHWRI